MDIDRLREIVGHAAAVVNKLSTDHEWSNKAYDLWWHLEHELTEAEKEATCPSK